MNTRQNETESRVEQKIVVAGNKEIQALHLRVIIQIKIHIFFILILSNLLGQ